MKVLGEIQNIFTADDTIDSNIKRKRETKKNTDKVMVSNAYYISFHNISQSYHLQILFYLKKKSENC